MKHGFALLIAAALTGEAGWAGNVPFPAFFAGNRGQAPAEVKFTMARPGGTAYFLRDGVTIEMAGTSIGIRFLNCALRPAPEGREPLTAVANYFEGNDPAKWERDVPLFRSLAYPDLWPGIDAVYSTSTAAFKSEFRISKNADPGVIHWNYGPGAKLFIENDGSLTVQMGGQIIREGTPEIYQEIDGRRVRIEGAYSIGANNDVGFRIGAYRRDHELVIDPVIVFTSLLGGSSQDQATGVASDAYGNIVVAGWTSSTSFPVTSGSRQSQFGGSVDAFVAKFGGNGSDLIFCTFLGGNGDDRAMGVAVDAAGNIYVAGHTASSNFPLAEPFQKTLSGSEDAFVAKLNASGTKLMYSTYLGGSGLESANAIAVDGYEQAYIGGNTSSTNFPIVGGAFATNQGGQDGFVAKLTQAGTAIVYSTYLGGSSTDTVAAIAVNSTGNAFVTGSTNSSNFPTVQAAQSTAGGNQDAFVSELQASGNGLVFSTYLGGSSGYAGLPEQGQAIAVDPAGNIYVAGTTSSSNFPVTSSALQGTFAGGNQDGFITEYTSAGRVNYSSFVGGSGLDYVNGIAVDPFGYVTAVGETSSANFPNTRGAQKTLKGAYDAFVTKYLFSGAVCTLINSGYLGGSGLDTAVAVALNGNGDALVAGYTGSSDFPIVTPLSSTKEFQTNNTGLTNAFVAKVANPFFPAEYTQVASGPQVNLDYARDGLFDGEGFTGKTVQWGNPGDILILGDWNQTGTIKAGVFRNGLWILDSNGNGILDVTDRQFTFGQAGDIPVVGDWNGTGVIQAGVFRQGEWILDLSGLIAGTSTGLASTAVTYGLPGDTPVTGDWTGTGTTQIGVFRDGFWILDVNGDHVLNGSDPFYIFGQPGDTPVTGDWDGSGISHPGIVRNNRWYLNYQWNNEPGTLGSAGTELTFTFGLTGGIPVIGKSR